MEELCSKSSAKFEERIVQNLKRTYFLFQKSQEFGEF